MKEERFQLCGKHANPSVGTSLVYRQILNPTPNTRLAAECRDCPCKGTNMYNIMYYCWCCNITPKSIHKDYVPS